MNELKKKVVQQEIAPKDETAKSGKFAPQPVEPKHKAAVLKRFILFLIFGNRIKFKNKTAYMTYMALLIALAIALSPLSIDIASVKITFSYLPCFIAAIYFGPLFAAFVGIIMPFSKFLLFGDYPPWLLNVVSQGLMGLIMGIAVQALDLLPGTRFKKIKLPVKIILGAAVILFVVTLGINTIAFMVEPFSPQFGWTYWQVLVFTIPPRIIFQPLVLALNTFLTVVLTVGLDRGFFKTNQAIYIRDLKTP